MGPGGTGQTQRRTAPHADRATGPEKNVRGQGPRLRHRFRRRTCLPRRRRDPDERPRLDGYGLPIGVRELRAYKGRPLAGVWATPPFLHNGSVPTIYQLLSPQDERSTTFYKGTFNYDPRPSALRPVRSRMPFCSTPKSPGTTTAVTNSVPAVVAMA
ncbi:hypothetical protein Ddc_21561 [Ditylenchus destructor]|nr:hypothetical protein Ddc_21561 [Ditylenchus destructor]